MINKILEKYYRFLLFLVWGVFMIIEIYYEGALTMFFTTESHIPFNSMRDVIRAYPDWKLMMKAGTDIYFLPYVESNDSDYIKFWNRVHDNPKESVYNSIEDVIEEYEKDSVVIHVSEAAVDVYTKYGRYDMANKLDVFYKGSSEYFNLIVSNNSPLGPILQHGSKIMFERGVFDYLNAKWFGKGKQTRMARGVSSSDKTVLNINHVLFAFGVYGSLVVASVAVLCGEACVKKFQLPSNK